MTEDQCKYCKAFRKSEYPTAHSCKVWHELIRCMSNCPLLNDKQEVDDELLANELYWSSNSEDTISKAIKNGYTRERIDEIIKQIIPEMD